MTIRGTNHHEIFSGIPSTWREVHHRAMQADGYSFVHVDDTEQWLRCDVRPWTAGGCGPMIDFAASLEIVGRSC